MWIFLGVLAGLFGGYFLGFVLSTGAHIGLGSVMSPTLVAVGLLPYPMALIGAVLVPIIVARRSE